jgi:hypothetical protein
VPKTAALTAMISSLVLLAGAPAAAGGYWDAGDRARPAGDRTGSSAPAADVERGRSIELSDLFFGGDGADGVGAGVGQDEDVGGGETLVFGRDFLAPGGLGLGFFDLQRLRRPFPPQPFARSGAMAPSPISVRPFPPQWRGLRTWGRARR